MYGIYANIYHQYTPNVSIYTSTMDPMGYINHSAGPCAAAILAARWESARQALESRPELWERLVQDRTAAEIPWLFDVTGLVCWGKSTPETMVKLPSNWLGFPVKFSHPILWWWVILKCFPWDWRLVCHGSVQSLTYNYLLVYFYGHFPGLS